MKHITLGFGLVWLVAALGAALAFSIRDSAPVVLVGGVFIFLLVVVAALFVNRNFRHRRVADLALLRSERELRATFRQAPLGLALLGSDRRWLHVNPRLCSMLGYSSDELKRGIFEKLIHPEEWNGSLDGVERVFDLQRRRGARIIARRLRKHFGSEATNGRVTRNTDKISTTCRGDTADYLDRGCKGDGRALQPAMVRILRRSSRR